MRGIARTVEGLRKDYGGVRNVRACAELFAFTYILPGTAADG